MKQLGWFLLLFLAGAGRDEFAALCADREAIERVYYDHRTGDKGPPEQALAKSVIEKLVREDLKKEVILKKSYGTEITSEQVAAEIKRINETTRAREVLQELKTTLGDDAVRFGRSVAKPLVVDRELRVRFANDDKLHLAKRKSAERARNGLIGAKKTNAPLATLVSLLKTNNNGAFHEVTWQFGITPPKKELERLDHFRFEDLSPQLQEVVRAQLRASGDISAVIETDTEFLLMLAKEKTAETLSAAILSVPKSSFDQWLQSLP